ncbi:MAG TPA: hypothetical protein PK210_05110 [Bacteroidia bacterium]|nr:hypothetical protein [Bacteroidia bacterium]
MILDTPITALREKLAFYQRFTNDLKARKGIVKDASQEKIDKLVLDLENKIEQFSHAISTLEINKSNEVRAFSYEDVYKIATDVMNLGMSLRQDQLKGFTDKSGNELLDDYMKKI